MSDVKELIERLRGDIFDAVPDDNDMQNVLSVAADALEAEHAEVERLRGNVVDALVQRDAAQKRHARMLARAERAEAELTEIRVEWGMDAWQTRTEAAEDEVARLSTENRAFNQGWATCQREVARLTAQLQAVREYVDEHEHPDDWNVPCVYVRDSVADAYCEDRDDPAHATGCPAALSFDRWLAAHDAELLARVRAGVEALPRLRRWIDDSELLDRPDVLDVLDRLGEQ